MEGLRSKRMSSNFSPLSELSTLAQVLLQSLDNTKVYILTNINRDPSLKPNIKSICGISSHHCFQFVDVNHVDYCVMRGDAWDVNHVSFTPGPQTCSSSSSSASLDHDETDDDDEDDITPRPCVHVVDDDTQLELDVNDDDDDEEEDEKESSTIEHSPPDTIASRVSKRQRVGKSTFVSIKGNDYFDIDDIDLG
jgi:hypothetical protein